MPRKLPSITKWSLIFFATVAIGITATPTSAVELAAHQHLQKHRNNVNSERIRDVRAFQVHDEEENQAHNLLQKSEDKHLFRNVGISNTVTHENPELRKRSIIHPQFSSDTKRSHEKLIVGSVSYPSVKENNAQDADDSSGKSLDVNSECPDCDGSEGHHVAIRQDETQDPLCKARSRTECEQVFNKCNGHGTCVRRRAYDRKYCYVCLCNSYGQNSDVSPEVRAQKWAGESCKYKDISVQFNLFLWLSIGLVSILASCVFLFLDLGKSTPTTLSSGYVRPKVE